MFWGLNLKPNRKYTQTTSKPFHISLASLDTDSVLDEGTNQIFINHDNQKFLICTLRKERCEQVMLDLNFSEGDVICFQCIGNGNVSLTGYLIDKFNFMDDGLDDEEESEAEEVDLRNTLNKKANTKKAAAAAKKAVVANEEDEDDDEDDSDYNGEGLDEVEEDEDEDEEESEDGDDDVEDDEDEEESEDEVQQPKAKQPKLEKEKTPKEQNGVTKENVTTNKKNKKAKKNEPQKQQQQKTGGERVLNGGVKIEEIRVGNGPEAKVGKRAQVYYEGRLKSNNKVFDSLKTGAGFKFSLGRGEVIKGWDIGVAGMKVGGKRRIICPPHMAYGARGSPPTIPPNSTLVFEVELKGVH